MARVGRRNIPPWLKGHVLMRLSRGVPFPEIARGLGMNPGSLKRLCVSKGWPYDWTDLHDLVAQVVRNEGLRAAVRRFGLSPEAITRILERTQK